MVMILIGVYFAREASIQEDLPTFLPESPSLFYVELVKNGRSAGVYQFSDAPSLVSVIRLTNDSLPVRSSTESFEEIILLSGEVVEVSENTNESSEVTTGWMSASHRIALRLKLHPDRMTLVDWQALPGIGPVLSEKIERDRQENGDFGVVDELHRVKGLGSGRIEKFRSFF